ncbi:MAG TPA: hypothetical protein VGD98_04740 [Ktedonobacteraceae bacterium]
MPVLNSERRSSSYNSSRHRTTATNQTTPLSTLTPEEESRSAIRATSKLVEQASNKPKEETRADELLARQLPSTAPRRTTGRATPRRATVPLEPVKPRLHPLFFVGLGLMIAVLLWVGISQTMLWGKDQLNTLRYGYPRTYQIDAFVGQGDSKLHPSHFEAINLHGVVTILEFPAGDASHVHLLETANVPGTAPDLAVVVLSFIDINADGKLDMLVDISGFQSILVNDGKTFHPPTPAEQQQFLQYLRQHSQ